MECFARPTGVYNMRLETVPMVSYGFRDIARHLLGDAELDDQLRQQLVQYMSENRHNNDLRIYEGINVELLYGSGMQPFIYHSSDDYLAKMSPPYTWANPKPQLYRPSTANRYTFTSTKPPYFLLLLPQRMTFTYVTCLLYTSPSPRDS